MNVTDLDYLASLDREYKFKEMSYCIDRRNGGLVNFQTKLVDV